MKDGREDKYQPSLHQGTPFHLISGATSAAIAGVIGCSGAEAPCHPLIGVIGCDAFAGANSPHFNGFKRIEVTPGPF